MKTSLARVYRNLPPYESKLLRFCWGAISLAHANADDLVIPIKARPSGICYQDFRLITMSDYSLNKHSTILFLVLFYWCLLRHRIWLVLNRLDSISFILSRNLCLIFGPFVFPLVIKYFFHHLPIRSTICSFYYEKKH